MACNGDSRRQKSFWEELMTKYWQRTERLVTGAATWERHFMLKQKVNRLFSDVWNVEYLYVEPSFSKAQITVVMKIIEKCNSLYFNGATQIWRRFWKVDDTQNGGRMIRKVGDFADMAEWSSSGKWKLVHIKTYWVQEPLITAAYLRCVLWISWLSSYSYVIKHK